MFKEYNIFILSNKNMKVYIIPSTDPSPQLPFLDIPTGVSGQMPSSGGQTEGEGEGVGMEDEEEETLPELMAVTEGEGEGAEDEVEEVVLELMAVTEGEMTGVGDVMNVAEFCTVIRVALSTACRGKSASLPAKSLAVGRRSDKQPPEALDIPFVSVQSGLWNIH